MKAVLFSIALLSSIVSSVAFSACDPSEAEFIGKVTELHRASGKNGTAECTIKIGYFRLYQESMVCPLDEGTASDLVVPSSTCDLKVGDEVSGYLSLYSDGRVRW